MTNNQPDRLDRIEATLERVSQQLDNQVVVNAELRQSTAELRQTTAVLTDVANVLMTSITTLTGVVSQHQENFVVITQQMREMREDMQEIQSDILGLQTENRRILGRLEGLENR